MSLLPRHLWLFWLMGVVVFSFIFSPGRGCKLQVDSSWHRSHYVYVRKKRACDEALAGPFKEHLHVSFYLEPWSRVAWLQQRPKVIALLEVGARVGSEGRGIRQVPRESPESPSEPFSPCLLPRDPEIIEVSYV